MGAVYLISGPMAAGKSTVARLLAARFERGVHVEGDLFRRSIVGGRVEIEPDAAPEAIEQLRLRYEIAAAAADRYFAAGFTVALEDVAAGPLLAEYAALVASRPLHVVVLIPSVAVLAAREQARPEAGYARWSIDGLHEEFALRTPRLGLWLDTSKQTPGQTVEAILAHCASSSRARESASASSVSRP